MVGRTQNTLFIHLYGTSMPFYWRCLGGAINVAGANIYQDHPMGVQGRSKDVVQGRLVIHWNDPGIGSCGKSTSICTHSPTFSTKCIYYILYIYITLVCRQVASTVPASRRKTPLPALLKERPSETTTWAGVSPGHRFSVSGCPPAPAAVAPPATQLDERPTQLF